MAHEPLDQHHREPPKQPPPAPQERQADDRVRESRHNGDAELRPLGAVVSQEAAGTSGSGNDGAGDWLRLGLAPASSSPLLDPLFSSSPPARPWLLVLSPAMSSVMKGKSSIRIRQIRGQGEVLSSSLLV